MKKTILTLALIAALSGFATPVRAEYQDGERVPDAVIAPLMAWVERHTGTKVPVLPYVVASRSRLTDVVSRMGRIQGRAKAMYVSGMVVLDHRQFDAEDVTQSGLLLHELVHYAQAFRNQRGWSCAQQKEVEAYTLQNRWLEEQGHAPFVNATWIERVSACPTTTMVAGIE